MFIFWGTKVVRKRVGFIADFCPICRGPQAFKLNRVGAASHIYNLSFGGGKLVGHEIQCVECGTALETDPLKYSTHSKQQGSTRELIQLTFPRLSDVHKDQLILENKIKSNPLSLTSEERREQLFTPFLLVSPKVEQRYSATHIDKEVWLVILGTIILAFLATRLVDNLLGIDAGTLVLSILGLGFILFIYQLAISGRRFMRKQIIPTIAKALTPINPTQEELEATLSELKQIGHKVGKKLKRSDLWAAVGSQN